HPLLPGLFVSTHTARIEIYTLSLHDALPIYCQNVSSAFGPRHSSQRLHPDDWRLRSYFWNSYRLCDSVSGSPSLCFPPAGLHERSEEHTSELQSLAYLVCRLLLDTNIVDVVY